jgi:peptide/nickel transport system substrate-binding protein
VSLAKNSRRLSLLPLLALLIGACAAGRVPDDELVVLIETPPVSIDPRYAMNSYDYKVGRLVYAPLVSTDSPTLEPKMELAQSVVANGNDWDITLRPDAHFSDGKPVTTDDVAYTFEAMLDPHTGGAAARIASSLRDAGFERLEIHDALHVTAKLSHPHAPFITDLNMGLMERPQPGHTADELPIGAGAYRFVARQGETWRFERNPYYFGGPAPEKRLVFKTIRDDNSRLLALVGGSGDLTQNTISQLLIDAVAEKKSRLRVETGPSSVYSYIGLNCEDPILKDLRVRRAIAYAIDRDTIIHTTLHDRAVSATGMLPTFHWAYDPDVPRYGFDPERAKKLLDEAGYPDPDGDGPLPRFTITYKTSSNKLRVAIATVIASMLRQVGIGVDLRVYEFATFYADVKKGNFQMFSMQIPEISEPDLYIQFFASWRIPTRENLDAGANRMRYRSPEVDALIEKGRRTLDRPGRIAVYHDIQRILARDIPVISLWHEDNIVAMRQQVHGFNILPTATMPSLAEVRKTR